MVPSSCIKLFLINPREYSRIKAEYRISPGSSPHVCYIPYIKRYEFEIMAQMHSSTYRLLLTDNIPFSCVAKIRYA